MAYLEETVSYNFNNVIDGVRSPLIGQAATLATYRDGLRAVGTGFTYLNNKLTGGTVTGLLIFGFEGTVIAEISGLSIAATQWQTVVDAMVANANAADMANLFAQQQWIFAGSALSGTFRGGNFADSIFGGYGDDNLTGGAGNDTIDGGYRDFGFNFETFSWDYDFVNYAVETGSQGVTVNLATGTAIDTFGNTDTLRNIEAVIGTAFSDTFTGDEQNNVFRGLAGADTIDGGGGNDEVRYDTETGGSGVVVNLAGNTATDTFGNTDSLISIERVRGSSRNDTITGDAGNNRFAGLSGADTINGGDGVDGIDFRRDEAAGGTAGIRANLTNGIARDGFGFVDTLTSIENVLGTRFYDRVVGSAVANSIFLFDGEDYIEGLGGNDSLYGGEGNDIVDGGAGDDSIVGDSGADDLRGGTGNDIIFGGSGDDSINGGSGDDSIYGGTEDDRWLSGGDGSDIVLGEAGDDTIYGGNGDDVYLAGGNGADVIVGEIGNDTIYGGEGNDAWLSGGSGSDVILGEGGNDLILGGDNNDIWLAGGEGNDVIVGEGGNDTILGEDGDDIWLSGGLGADVIIGGNGNDNIRGDEDGDLWLSGEAGNDGIYGGAGADLMSGGTGSDRFDYLAVSEGGDTIVDFSAFEDWFYFSAAAFGVVTNFVFSANPAPTAAAPTILYNTATGVLSYDADGIGGALGVTIVTLNGAPAISQANFLFA